MEAKLRGRTIVIAVVILLCILGIIGLPKNVQELKQNARNHIRLGLDLKGGTHLILQVQVEDAVNITNDQARERLQDEFRAKNIPYSDIQKVDSTHILIKGVPQEKSSDIQALASEQFSDWELSRIPGDPTSRMLSIKTTAAANLRNQALL